MTRHAAVQTMHLRLERIADDLLDLGGGRARAVLAVAGVPFGLLGADERTALVASYVGFLGALGYPIQVLVRTAPLDLDGYLAPLDASVDAEVPPPLAALARDHAVFLRRLARERALLERQHYLVVPADDGGAGQEARWPFGRHSETAPASAARQQLAARCDEVRGGLGRCGLDARRLSSHELAELCIACWRPDRTTDQRLRAELLAFPEPDTAAPPQPRLPAGTPRAWLAHALRRASGRTGPAAGEGGSALPGVRSVADLIAPAAVEVARGHLRLERQYVRVLALTGYPRAVSPGWLDPLLAFPEPLEVSLHIVPRESGPMVRQLTRQLGQLDSSRSLAIQKGQLTDPERETAFADAQHMRDVLQRGEERGFSVALYVLVRADDLATLEAATRRVERTLDGLLAQSRRALWEQDLGFHACLPELSDGLNVVHTLDTSSVATMFPFSAAGIAMPEGVLFGVATDSHAPVIVDPFADALENANLAIFATSGAGKSYFTKLLLLRAALRGVEAIVVDPEDEFGALCRALDGQEIRLAGSSGQAINPFDLPPASGADDEAGQDPLQERIAALVGLLELMVGEAERPLGPEERGVLERALEQTYAQAGITHDPASHGAPPPLLADLHAVLAGGADPAAVGLASRLYRYAHGSLAGLFRHRTNVALQQGCVVFHLQSLEPDLRPIGIHLIAGYLWQRMRRDRRPRLLVVDEAWSLLQYPAGGAFLAGMARRARKYGLGLVTITQDVADALGSVHGRTVLTNAACTLLLKQNAATVAPLAEAFGLSEGERRYLLGAAKGEGLFSCRGARLPLRVLASPREHALATTTPREVAAREARPERATRPGGAPSADAGCAPPTWRQWRAAQNQREGE